MERRLQFRHRIGLLVLLAALGLVTVTAVTLVLGQRSQHQLQGIETRYVPLIELDRDLKTTFAQIRQAFEDAAAAAEDSRLKDADALADAFIRRLTAGAQAITDNGGDPNALEAEFRVYFANARDVSAAIVAGAPAAQLGTKIENMGRVQQAFTSHLETATSPDRSRLTAAFATARESQTASLWIDISVASAVLALMALMSWRFIRRTVRALSAVSMGVERLARGDFGHEIAVPPGDEIGELAREANRTAVRLRDYRLQGEREDWIKTGLAELAEHLAGDLDPITLGRKAMTYLAKYLGAEVAVAYTGDEGGVFSVLDTYGVDTVAAIPPSFRLGETLLGQVARDDEVRVLANVPADYLTIRSALGEAKPRHVVIVPLTHEGRAMGVLELGLLEPPSERALDLMSRVRSTVGIAFRVAESRQRAQALLAETQRQAEELRSAYDTLETRNSTLVSTQQLLEERAEELARASRYKSEFLANMSHELRTPLNSIMILSKVLAENEERSLTDKQVEFATLINKSGEELLALINEVLDLAKVEAGKQSLACAQLPLAKLEDYVRRMFQPIANDKRLGFQVELEAGLPAEIRTDWARLTQILKNLIANAVKFTARGSVTVRVTRTMPTGVPAVVDPVVISVTDTGIGIPVDKQAWIFEAFAQAESGTSRKFGGTGLGLTIAKQLAVRLGGDLIVESTIGKGSTFHLILPITGPTAEATELPPPSTTRSRVTDDRDAIVNGEPCMLVVEDDHGFATIVLDLVRTAGFKGLVAANGYDGLELARRFKPSGIVLDVGLPDMDGWSVMESLKGDIATRDIPVHFITATDDADRAKRAGAVGLSSKPVEATQISDALHALEAAARANLRKILVVEPDAALRGSLAKLLAMGDIEVDAVATRREALARLAVAAYGCVVMNVALPDKEAGFNFVATIRSDAQTAAVPIVVHAGVPLTTDEITKLQSDDRAIVVLQGEHSTERVIEEARLFAHRVRAELPEQRRRMTESVHNSESVFEGKTVLIVDDDMRNVYSLSSALRAKHLNVITAADGQEALDELERHPRVDIVLMDVMMPRMDGHEATRKIRVQERFQQLPIVALTAKTMVGEREKCLEAGANDYVAKPIDISRLLGLMRVWLS